MLDAAGAKSLDDLFRSIPASLRLKRPLDVPPAVDEISLFAELGRLAARNDVSHPPFAGAGCYPHHVPPAVDQLLLRGEFFTAYTPYQPEVSQGTLQALFEWQTFVCLLTGLDVSNASMYDGATATAEAALMATRLTGRKKIVVSAALHPEYRKVLATYLRSTHDEIAVVPFGPDGRTDLAALERAVGSDAACVIAGWPNFLGVVEPLPEIVQIARRAGALTVASTAEAVALVRRRLLAADVLLAGSCSPSRPASSTSAARRRRRTSAPTPASPRSPPRSTSRSSGRRGSRTSPA